MGEVVKKETVGKPVFWVSFILCAGLLVAGFVVQTTGVIDPSVLKGGGLLFAVPTPWIPTTKKTRRSKPCLT